MATPHPLFARIHAYLCGGQDLLASGVSEQVLLSLYPAEMASYHDFFTNFWRKHRAQLDDLAALGESYRLLDSMWEAVQQRVTLGIYDDEQYDRHWTVTHSELPRQVEALAAEISEAAVSEPGYVQHRDHIYASLHAQFTRFTEVMLLLSDWPTQEIEDDAALGRTTLHVFFRGFEKLLAYYGLRVRFDTEERRLAEQMRRELAAEAAEFEAREQPQPADLSDRY